VSVDRDPSTSRFARLELERRWLLASVPADAARPVRITDRYIAGTNLRLRKMEDLDGASAPVFKFTQKVRPDPRDPKRVSLTTIYLAAGDYDLLCSHPADVLVKTRYRAAGGAVDVFEGRLEPLVLFEAEFASEDEMAAFAPPGIVLREVSDDDRFSGGRLAAMTGAEASRLVAATYIQA
jgi:CYTH domain-containing protein